MHCAQQYAQRASKASMAPWAPTTRGRACRPPRPVIAPRAASVTKPSTFAAPKKDLSSQLLQSIFKLALQSRLKSYGSVDVDAVCDARSLLDGLFNGIHIRGTSWVTPLQMTAQLLQVDFGELHIDLSKLLWERRVALLNVPQGNVRIVLTAEDLGNFMVHPLMAQAAAKAVQGEPFAFQREAVAITPQNVFFAGSWRGKEYSVTMSPVSSSVEGTEQPALRVVARAADGNTSDEGASAVALGLAQFFGSLELDLQGIEISRPSLLLASSSRKDTSAHYLEIQMKVQLRALPPLNMQF